MVYDSIVIIEIITGGGMKWNENLGVKDIVMKPHMHEQMIYEKDSIGEHEQNIFLINDNEFIKYPYEKEN